jgi:8-amino-7-oxononanoate synthase
VVMIDFTSSLYLGMQHSSAELPGWHQLTTGKPSALFEPPQSKILAQKIACMQGLEAGCMAPSTLHLYYDVYNFLSQLPVVVFIDEDVYPVSKYGIEKLYPVNIGVYTFKHLDAMHLQKLVAVNTQKWLQPVVITDGWCPLCGRPAPLNVYADILKPYNGILITDDTQATGIFGKKDGRQLYGSGGGGILQWLNVNKANTICIASLAKGFGVPVAAITGSALFIDLFKNKSQAMVYSSQPGTVHLSAGLHALQLNNQTGDRIREKIFKNVMLMKALSAAKSIRLSGGIFPVQSISFGDAAKAVAVYNKLLQQQIKTALIKGHKKNETAVIFIITGKHTSDEITETVYCIGKAMADK